MTQFHDRTLTLLGDEPLLGKRSHCDLVKWGRLLSIKIPAAFLEWAMLDDGSILHKYSNDDWYYFDEPKLVVLPDGAKGLHFNSENQNNFDRIVLLDQGDDPPVLFGWLAAPPWVRFSERFSDAVFAQIFDWQYWLEFNPTKEITVTGDINRLVPDCLQELSRRYEQTVTTQYLVEGVRYSEYRFIHSPTLRLTALVTDAGVTDIRITGRPMEAVKALENELRGVLTPFQKQKLK